MTRFNNEKIKIRSWQTVCYLRSGRKITVNQALEKLNEYFKDDLGDKYELETIKMKFFFPTIRGKKELTEDERNSRANYINNYLLIVNEKGTPIPNEEEIKVEGHNSEELALTMAAMDEIDPSGDSVKDKFKQLLEKIKSKFSKKDESSDDKKDE